MIDSHCHLDLAQFDSDVDEVLSEARHQGVTRFLIPGTTQQGWEKQFALAERYCDIDIALGLHPYFLKDNARANEQNLVALTLALDKWRDRVVAIGETGLDCHISVPVEIQYKVLCKQLEIAQRAALPVVLHHRKSHHLLFKALKETGFDQGGVVHAFSGSEEVAYRYISKGFLLGIGGTITYPRGQRTRDVINAIGLSHLLLETDAPDMPMYGRQGQRNTPAFLPDVVNVMAELFCLSSHDVIAQTTHNYASLFGRCGAL